MSSLLHEIVELPTTLINYVVPLLQVEELLQLVVHEALRYVMATEGGVELAPQDLVITLW
jgi:hypothetical protein